ncbi:MAG: GGDEF domain-containing protein [Polyangia bacterium]|nr:GGDEF domain-containing protein [Polyangia bacterium]
MDRQNKTVVTVIHNLTAKPEARDACVVVIYGPELGKKYNLDGPSLIIGRSSKCDIQIDQESVSRNHAKIVNNGQSVMIRDLGSTNGTVVNDKPQTEIILRDGDLITIGRTILKFITGDNIENAYHEEIYRLTTVDGLTQTYNKRYFLETLEREISRAARYQRALSLIMFDLDHFKNVNDTHGHLAGDYVLKHLAQVIANRIRREDVLARYGGEEFSIILPEIERDNAVFFADKIRRLVERTPFTFENRTLPITISVGVATWAPDVTNPADLIRRADERLYEAKAAGRNCVKG